MPSDRFSQDYLTDKDWADLKQAFIPEGALIDIVVLDLSEYDWDVFFKTLLNQFKTIEVKSKGTIINVESKEYAFKNFKKYFDFLEEGEPASFFVCMGEVQLHFTIYDVDMVELTLNPYKINSKASILVLLNLMFELASNLKRTIKLKLDGYSDSLFEFNSAGKLKIYPENMPEIEL
ncbi:hypothetical protein KA183_00085 [bacterium]|nr:hypothetical protein [bacterium]QQR57297.1 MAG: hypothetical protein IPG59_20310 [Candidatus Melainabacteria bacterium]